MELPRVWGNGIPYQETDHRKYKSQNLRLYYGVDLALKKIPSTIPKDIRSFYKKESPKIYFLQTKDYCPSDK